MGSWGTLLPVRSLEPVLPRRWLEWTLVPQTKQAFVPQP